jgi:hypothetical protein
VGYGMDEVEQDQHEARLKELFDSFDTTGTGSLGQEELTDLCHMLSLEEVAPLLHQTLLQDNLLGRVRSGEEHSLWEVGCSFCWGARGGARQMCCNLFLATWPLNLVKEHSGCGLTVQFGEMARVCFSSCSRIMLYEEQCM